MKQDEPHDLHVDFSRTFPPNPQELEIAYRNADLMGTGAALAGAPRQRSLIPCH